MKAEPSFLPRNAPLGAMCNADRRVRTTYVLYTAPSLIQPHIYVPFGKSIADVKTTIVIIPNSSKCANMLVQKVI